VALVGCGGSRTSNQTAAADAELLDVILSADEAPGWTITPDEGAVDGDTPDCTGAPYTWPDISTTAHASQFLDRADETVGLVLKRLSGRAAQSVEALRGALEPCAPEGHPSLHGAMIDVVGDDSFAYQVNASDVDGDYLFSNMVISCGELILEASSISYSGRLDQAELEALVAPVVARMTAAEQCG
jgi:hypothetical protein